MFQEQAILKDRDSDCSILLLSGLSRLRGMSTKAYISAFIGSTPVPTAPIVMLLEFVPALVLSNPVTDPRDAPLKYPIAPPVPSSATLKIVALEIALIVQSLKFLEYHLNVLVK